MKLSKWPTLSFSVIDFQLFLAFFFKNVTLKGVVALNHSVEQDYLRDMKKKPSYNDRRCKVRINIKRFEAIQLNETDWGYATFYHCLN